MKLIILCRYSPGNIELIWLKCSCKRLRKINNNNYNYGSLITYTVLLNETRYSE